MQGESRSRSVTYNGETFTVREKPWMRKAVRTGQPPKPPKPRIPRRRFEHVDPLDAFDPRGCFVYLLFEADADRPFYIGQSVNVLGRLGTHASTYRGRIARVQLIRCETEPEMLALERQLLSDYKPMENRRGVVPLSRET